MDITVVNEREKNRFATHIDGYVAELEYSLEGNQLTLKHTRVPQELGGRGIAGELVKAVLAWAEAEGLVIAPWCSYTRAWFEKNPYEAARVKIDWANPPKDHGRDRP